MHINPLLSHARDSALLLDAAAYTLDANLVIRNAHQRETYAIVQRHRGNVVSMAEEAWERMPDAGPEEMYEMVRLECELLHELALQAGLHRPMRSNRNERVLGRSGFPAHSRGDLNLHHQAGHIDGLVWSGASPLGVSCPFIIKNSGTSATRGFWMDALSGLPAGGWLSHRAEHANYLSEFQGGPWAGYELDDHEIATLAVEYASVFCDYHASRFAVSDPHYGLRFRFLWRGQSVHSEDLMAERYRIADIQRRIKHHAM